MKLRNSCFYNNGCSCLYFRVIKVQYESSSHYKVKGQLVDINGNVHEGPKNYKLKKELIQDWKEEK